MIKVYLFFTISLAAALSCPAQVSQFKLEKHSLVGTWILTDFNDPDSFQDVWQFDQDGSWCELKATSDIDSTLRCDEQGSWQESDGELTIEAVKELSGGQLKYYEEPFALEFEIQETDQGGFRLTVVSAAGADVGQVLLLSPLDSIAE